jgi:hypothetical protein
MSKFLLTILVAVLALLTTTFAGTAQSNDPFAGLPAPAVTIAQAIDSGDASSIVGHLASTGIVKTAYPGGGETVAHETAAADIAAAIVSSPDKSDDQGTGAYRLLAVWIPRVDPSGVHLVGSGISASGTRITTVFTVENGTIDAYGRAVDTAGILAQFAKDGDLRLVTAGSVTPAAPTVGTGVKPDGGGIMENPFVVAGLALVVVGMLSMGVYRIARARA